MGIPRASQSTAAHGGAAEWGWAGQNGTRRRTVRPGENWPSCLSGHRGQLFWMIPRENKQQYLCIKRWKNKTRIWPAVYSRFIRGLSILVIFLASRVLFLKNMSASRLFRESLFDIIYDCNVIDIIMKYFGVLNHPSNSQIEHTTGETVRSDAERGDGARRDRVETNADWSIRLGYNILSCFPGHRREWSLTSYRKHKQIKFYVNR